MNSRAGIFLSISWNGRKKKKYDVTNGVSPWKLWRYATRLKRNSRKESLHIHGEWGNGHYGQKKSGHLKLAIPDFACWLTFAKMSVCFWLLSSSHGVSAYRLPCILRVYAAFTMRIASYIAAWTCDWIIHGRQSVPPSGWVFAVCRNLYPKRGAYGKRLWPRLRSPGNKKPLVYDILRDAGERGSLVATLS